MNVLKDSIGLKAGVNANNILNVLKKNLKNIFLMNKSALYVLTLCLNVANVVLKIYVINVLTDSTG
jgi:hypothetical protein